VINAGTDAFPRQVGPEKDRLDVAVARANHYLDAGADCAFVPGGPSIAALGDLGVTRVSVGPGLAQVALGVVRRAGRKLLGSGSYRLIGEGLNFAEVDALMGS